MLQAQLRQPIVMAVGKVQWWAGTRMKPETNDKGKTKSIREAESKIEHLVIALGDLTAGSVSLT